jgi:hypothetical protein
MGRPIAAVLLFSLTLAGCATGYNDLKNPLSLTGGYWDEPGPGKLVKVGFAGNAFIEREQGLAFVDSLDRGSDACPAR